MIEERQKRWVLCNYPTDALAQEAEMSLGEYADFVYGGTNKSAIHWDMIKDLRFGGEILVDGRVVQKDGKFLI